MTHRLTPLQHRAMQALETFAARVVADDADGWRDTDWSADLRLEDACTRLESAGIDASDTFLRFVRRDRAIAQGTLAREMYTAGGVSWADACRAARVRLGV